MSTNENVSDSEYSRVLYGVTTGRYRLIDLTCRTYDNEYLSYFDETNPTFGDFSNSEDLEGFKGKVLGQIQIELIQQDMRSSGIEGQLTEAQLDNVLWHAQLYQSCGALKPNFLVKEDPTTGQLAYYDLVYPKPEPDLQPEDNPDSQEEGKYIDESEIEGDPEIIRTDQDLVDFVNKGRDHEEESSEDTKAYQEEVRDIVEAMEDEGAFDQLPEDPVIDDYDEGEYPEELEEIDGAIQEDIIGGDYGETEGEPQTIKVILSRDFVNSSDAPLTADDAIKGSKESMCAGIEEGCYDAQGTYEQGMSNSNSYEGVSGPLQK